MVFLMNVFKKKKKVLWPHNLELKNWKYFKFDDFFSDSVTFLYLSVKSAWDYIIIIIIIIDGSNFYGEEIVFFVVVVIIHRIFVFLWPHICDMNEKVRPQCLYCCSIVWPCFILNEWVVVKQSKPKKKKKFHFLKNFILQVDFNKWFLSFFFLFQFTGILSSFHSAKNPISTMYKKSTMFHITYQS